MERFRRQFELDVQWYGDVAKRARELDAQKKEAGADKQRIEQEELSLFSDFKEEAGDIAHEQRTSVADQMRIANFQMEKQEIMEQLQHDLKRLDQKASETEQPKDARFVTVQGGQYIFETDRGRKKTVTKGEIMTDGDWGIEYSFDSAVSRNVRKRYLIEQAKRQLRECWNKQILVAEMGSERTDQGKKDAYKALKEKDERGFEQPGHIAEQMVRNFLKKMTYDFDVAFEVLQADFYQDVEKKVDFIIHRTSRYRGVKVKTAEAETVGIQFTTDPTEEKQKQKQRQILRAKQKLTQEDYVEDIVLVTIPLNDTRRLYEAWKKTESPGGPDKLWSTDQKERIFRLVMKDVLTTEEIEQHVRLVFYDGGEHR